MAKATLEHDPMEQAASDYTAKAAEQPNGDTATKTRQKQQTPKPAKKRTNFAKELQALKARVDTAVRLLRRGKGDGSRAPNADLIDVALEILTGE